MSSTQTDRNSTAPRPSRATTLRCALLLAVLSSSSLLAQGRPGGGPGGPGHPGMPGSGPGAPGGPGMGRGNPPPGGSAPGTPGQPGSRLQGPAGRWWDEGRYAQTVGLTTEQQRRMDSVFQENRSALVSGLDNLRRAQSRLDTLSATDHPSETALLNEIQNVAQARADLAKTNTHMLLQIRNEMTDEQITKLDKIK